MKQYCALCLAVLLLFSPICHLLSLVSTTNQKLDELQQIQLLESEKMNSELERLREELQKYQTHCDPTLIAVLFNCQCASGEDNPEPGQGTIPPETHSDTHPVTQPTSPIVNPTDAPTTRRTIYYGRLCIPDVGIDVGLYYGAQQEICDRQDSANIFSMRVFDGLYIADHNTQEFGKLANVTVGMRGYLKLADGTIFPIICTEVLDGYNTGNHIVDQNGNANLDADYLMYTCGNSRSNILICLWKHS